MFAAWVAAACGPAPAASVTTGPVVLRVGIAQPRGSQGPETGLLGVSSLLQGAPLVAVDGSGRPEPAVASGWTRSADGLTWTFAIRRGLTFHDGSLLDAGAVAGLLVPADVREHPFSIPPGLREVEAVAATASHELTIRLRRPAALLLEALALVPVRGGTSGESGAGPFVLDHRAPDLVTLRAFDGYYRGRPLVDRVELRSYATQRAAWGAMMRDDVDVLYEVAPDAVEFVQAGGTAQVFQFLRPYVYVVGFNVSRPVLAAPGVRRALGQAIDRSAVVERALGGRGVPATGHVWPRHWTFDRGAEPPPFDPVAASRALGAAGFPLSPSVPGSGRPPARLRLRAIVPAEYPILERVAIVVQRQLADVGVDLQLEPLPLRDFAARLAEGRFEAYIHEMAAGQGLNWPHWFWHSPGDGAGSWLRSGYASADLALESLQRATTDDEVRRAVRAFEDVLIADPPALFLCWSETSRAVHRRFEVPTDDDRDVMRTLPQWRPARPSLP